MGMVIIIIASITIIAGLTAYHLYYRRSTKNQIAKLKAKEIIFNFQKLGYQIQIYAYQQYIKGEPFVPDNCKAANANADEQLADDVMQKINADVLNTINKINANNPNK